MSELKTVETIRINADEVMRSDRMMGLVVKDVFVNDDKTTIDFSDGNSIVIMSKSGILVQRDYLNMPFSLSRSGAATLFKVLEDANHPFATTVYQYASRLGWDLGVDLGIRKAE
jgi:hypothetical protein